LETKLLWVSGLQNGSKQDATGTDPPRTVDPV
jgi:hypothetical protein